MKYLALAFLAITMVGCADKGDGVYISKISMEGAERGVNDSESSLLRANQNLKIVYKNGSSPFDPLVKAIMEDTGLSLSSLENTKKELNLVKIAQSKRDEDYAKVVTRLNYIEPKYSDAVGLLWKWRLLAFINPIVALIIGIPIGAVLMAIFRLWLKANLPIIGNLIP